MNKKTYTKPAVAVIDVKFESALMQMSQLGDNQEGQNPDNNKGGNWSDGFETKGDGGFWDEW